MNFNYAFAFAHHTLPQEYTLYNGRNHVLKAFAAKPHVTCKNVIYSHKRNRIA